MDLPGDRPLLRIGELSRRLGVSGHVLRAWESRYGLLQPVRSAGGFRLYSAGGRDGGSAGCRPTSPTGFPLPRPRAPCFARTGRARQRRTSRPGPPGPDLAASTVSELSAALRQALDAFDEPAAQAVLDRLFSDLSLITVLRDVVLRYLAELGERWERGTASIAQEHFASNIIRGRLAGLARGWGGGHGPRAVLACPPGEQHDMALMIFGIVLNRGGWRIDYFGASTPVEELERTVEATRPGLVVLAATRPEALEPLRPKLARLARLAPLALAGAGATPQLASAAGARLMAGNPVTEAEQAGWSR